MPIQEGTVVSRNPSLLLLAPASFRGDKGLFWFTLVLEVGGTVADAAVGFFDQGHPHAGGLEHNAPQGGLT